MIENPRAVNPQGGIQATNTKTGADLYIAPGTILHDLALAGTFGPVEPYVEPPKPEEPPTFATAEAALAAMAEWASAFVAPLLAGTPPEERLSWPVKEKAARDYLEGIASADDAAMIEAEAAVTGEAPADLCASILDQAATFRAVSARIAGLRRKTRNALIAEPDPYKFDAILAAAQAEARAMATDLGIADVLGLEPAVDG